MKAYKGRLEQVPVPQQDDVTEEQLVDEMGKKKSGTD